MEEKRRQNNVKIWQIYKRKYRIKGGMGGRKQIEKREKE